MEKKNLSGEYLAPKIKVTRAKALQVLCSSASSSPMVSNPFGGSEENWSN